MPVLHITIKPPFNTAQPYWKPTTTGLSTKMIFLKANTDVKSSALLGGTKKSIKCNFTHRTVPPEEGERRCTGEGGEKTNSRHEIDA